MKITLDKKVITLEEIAAAKELQKEWSQELDNNLLESMACRASGYSGNLIKVESLEVTKNHFELTVWATVILEDYDKFVKTSFDVLQANWFDRDHYDHYTRVYKLVD